MTSRQLVDGWKDYLDRGQRTFLLGEIDAAIAEAVSAEREACAKIAEGQGSLFQVGSKEGFSRGVACSSASIAAAIRTRDGK